MLMQGVDMNTDESNTLGGTISEFRDGDVDLGFEVTLERVSDNEDDRS